MTEKTPTRPLWQKLLVTFIATAVFLLIIEGICTILYNADIMPQLVASDGGRLDIITEREFDVGFINRPNAHYQVNNKYRSGRVLINSWGYREARDVSPEKTPNEFRILCLGDSSTFGVGLDQNQTYPARLQMILDKRNNGRIYKVYNGGRSAYSSFNLIRFLEKHGAATKPDIITISVGFADYSYKNIPDKDKDYRLGPLPGVRRILFYTNTYWMLLQALSRMRAGQIAELTRGHRVAAEDYEANLHIIISMVRDIGAQPIFMPITVPPEYRDILWRVAAEDHVVIVDTEESLIRAFNVIMSGATNYHGVPLGRIFDLDTKPIEEFKGTKFNASYSLRVKSYIMDDMVHPNPIGMLAIAEDLAAIIP